MSAVSRRRWFAAAWLLVGLAVIGFAWAGLQRIPLHPQANRDWQAVGDQFSTRFGGRPAGADPNPAIQADQDRVMWSITLALGGVVVVLAGFVLVRGRAA